MHYYDCYLNHFQRIIRTRIQQIFLTLAKKFSSDKLFASRPNTVVQSCLTTELITNVNLYATKIGYIILHTARVYGMKTVSCPLFYTRWFADSNISLFTNVSVFSYKSSISLLIFSDVLSSISSAMHQSLGNCILTPINFVARYITA